MRLRSFPSIYPLTSAMAVGCGYAAHGGIETGKGWLFRLSDGYSWQLPMAGCTPPNLSNDICLNRPLAITCDEVFVQAVGKVDTIVRLSMRGGISSGSALLSSAAAPRRSCTRVGVAPPARRARRGSSRASSR
jgi:hypothetical protein